MLNSSQSARRNLAAEKAASTRTARAVTHVYDRAEASAARELGTQCRMLCGVWGWPARRDSGVRAATGDGTPSRCKRCAIVLAARERRRADEVALVARRRAEFLAARPLLEFAVDDAIDAGVKVYVDAPRRLDGERVRCEVGREYGVKPYVRLSSNLSEIEALWTLAAARHRLSHFGSYVWFFEDDDHDWPFVVLCDRR